MSIADKLATIAENQQKVYNAGFEAGRDAGGGGGSDPTPTQEKTVDVTENGTVVVTPDNGYALSKVTANVNVQGSGGEDFWDVYQENGNRTIYHQGFSGSWWTDERFNPKYPITPTNCTYMFQNSLITDVSAVNIDFSGVTSNMYATRTFDVSSITKVGTVDLSNATGTFNTFFGYGTAGSSKLVYIEKLILPPPNIAIFGTNFFQNCSSLTDITIEGTINCTLNMLSCPLSSDSVDSILEHLADLTGQAQKKITFSSDVAANLTEAQLAILTRKNWTT